MDSTLCCYLMDSFRESLNSSLILVGDKLFMNLRSMSLELLGNFILIYLKMLTVTVSMSFRRCLRGVMSMIFLPRSYVIT